MLKEANTLMESAVLGLKKRPLEEHEIELTGGISQALELKRSIFVRLCIFQSENGMSIAEAKLRKATASSPIDESRFDMAVEGNVSHMSPRGHSTPSIASRPAYSVISSNPNIINTTSVLYPFHGECLSSTTDKEIYSMNSHIRTILQAIYASRR